MDGPETSRDWERARDVFLDLADLDPAERARELQKLEREDVSLYAWVRRLLEQDLGPDEAVPEAASQPPSGREFGPYRTVRQIGAGGMGEVYLAQRTDGEYELEVAIKSLHPGPQSEELLQRFLRERQVLARLNHEGIARLIDGGTTDQGQPYLVLEYVDGRRIDAYCREEELDTRERVVVFCKVLAAVRFAHERGVIHRDLKPSNILVRADGAPRLLDFGIAREVHADDKATPSLTSTGQRLFTPEFASPEQVRGEPADATSDIFALGVILYTMLTDVGPWGGASGLHEFERAILELDPKPPSHHLEGARRRAVAGDLDTIVLACLAKRPRERIASVAELAGELDRHLRLLPIRTKPVSLTSRVLRAARRNPWRALTAMVLAVALPIAANAWRSSTLASRRGAELAASLRERIAAAVHIGHQNRFDEATSELRDVVSVLQTLPGQRLLKVEASAALARALFNQRENDEAYDLARDALAQLPEPTAEDARVRAQLLNTLANVRPRKQSLAACRAAYEHAKEWLDPSDELFLSAVTAYALHADAGTFQERLLLLEEAEASARSQASQPSDQLGSLLASQGKLWFEAGHADTALPLFDEALEVMQWHYGEAQIEVAFLRGQRGRCLGALRRFEEAEAELRTGLANMEAKDHGDVAAFLQMYLGELYVAQGKSEAAVGYLTDARNGFLALYGPNNSIVADLAGRIGREYRRLGRWEEARDAYEEALAHPQALVSFGKGNEADCRYYYARVLLELGEQGLAREQLERTLELAAQAFGDDHPKTQTARELLATLPLKK